MIPMRICVPSPSRDQVEMNVMFALLAKRAFSDVLEGLSSKNFSFAPLSCSRPGNSAVNICF